MIINNSNILLMGILNITPDSFSDGGKYISLEKAVERGLEMEKEGADIIDIGGESTRPFAEPVSLEEELERVIPVIEKIRDKSDIKISVDTYKSEVAEEAIRAGANIINDISGATFDNRMKGVIKRYDKPIIIMHIKGTPKNMQINPEYDDLIGEIKQFLVNRKKELNEFGIKDDKIIIDPGIGFGKKIEHNYIIINRLNEFKSVGLPILIGASRKSFLGKPFDYSIEEREEGTCVSSVISILNGVSILRVHNIVSAKRVINTMNMFLRYK
jgi:dihydropteroate synthase